MQSVSLALPVTDLFLDGYGSDALRLDLGPDSNHDFSRPFYIYRNQEAFLASAFRNSNVYKGRGVKISDQTDHSMLVYPLPEKSCLILENAGHDSEGKDSYRTGSFDYDFNHEQEHVMFGIERSGLVAGGGLSAEEHLRDDYSLGFGFVKKGLTLEKFKSCCSNSVSTENLYGTDNILLDNSELDLREGLRAGIKASKFAFGTERMRQSVYPADVFSLSGTYSAPFYFDRKKVDYSAEFQLDHNYRLEFLHGTEKIQSKLEFYHTGYFGWLGMPEARHDYRGLGIKRELAKKSWKFSGLNGKFLGNGRGRIDSWPFSSVNDYFHSAGIVFYDFKVGIQRLNLGFSREFSRKLNLDAGIQHLNLKPSGDLRTFYSTLFGFFRIPLDDYSLKYSLIQVLIPSATMEYKIRRNCAFSLSMAQYLPYRQVKIEEPEVPSQPQPQPGQVATHEKRKQQGGTVMELAVKYWF
ncbi:MAG: hypothetical protein PHW04_01340 [Candidatus Wallbacteria bacterium]|nr:hypothetical protein [Candidatus Wallbacteria bacterium]